MNLVMDQQINTHYSHSDLTATILAGLQAAGKAVNELTPDDLGAIDQFHIRGKAATLELAQRSGITATTRVLDVGGGIGGPARTLAGEVGCTVTVLDLTAEYCKVGELLTAYTRLGDRVTFQQGSALAMPFADASFDLVWTQHSAMNIADKAQLYAECARVLRPGGRLALHEVMAGSVSPILFPVPWARQPAINFLLSPTTLQGLITASGFETIAWVDESVLSLQWLQERLVAASTVTSPPPLGLHLLLGPEAGAMLRNYAHNLRETRIAVYQGIFVRN